MVKNMKVVVLGGAGTVGSWTVIALVISRFFDEIALGDIDIEKAKKLAEELGGNTAPDINHKNENTSDIDTNPYDFSFLNESSYSI